MLPFSGILICTDVMARGVDIPEVNWVIQYDPPSSARYFLNLLWYSINVCIISAVNFTSIVFFAKELIFA